VRNSKAPVMCAIGITRRIRGVVPNKSEAEAIELRHKSPYELEQLYERERRRVRS